jgi:U3 small nucleolar RNA-associated protein 21
VESVFVQKLAAEGVNGDCKPIPIYLIIACNLTTTYEDESFFNYAKTLSPAALELELRSLVTIDDLSLFINALTQRLLSHRDFEAVQALQAVFLRMHGEVLIANPEIRLKLEGLREVQRKESQKVLELIASSLGTLGFVRDTL